MQYVNYNYLRKSLTNTCKSYHVELKYKNVKLVLGLNFNWKGQCCMLACSLLLSGVLANV